MLVNDIALMTAAKARALTTKIVGSLMGRVANIPFVARSRKAIIVLTAVWLVLAALGYLAYRAAADRADQAFYQEGFETARHLAAKSRSFVLGQDALALNALIRDTRAVDSLAFAAIVDHLNVVLSHTDAEMINRSFRPLGRVAEISTLNGTRAIAGLTAGNQPVVGFFHTIRFADVPIGQAVVAFDISRLEARVGMMRQIYVSIVTLLLIGGAAVLFRRDRSRQQKARQIRIAMEKADRIGPYRLREKIAKGGMAELFRADYVREDGFRRTVAVKRIRPHLAEDTDFIKMFTREARLAALLQHPNIVQIFDYGKIDRAHFIAMEYVDGRNLAEILAVMKIGLPFDQAVYIVSEICKGLDYAHSRRDDETGLPLGIVHRDISPQNMMISCQGEVKISDFGISKAKSEPSLTQAGTIKGKLAYMSPEQALGRPLDCRADIYALGLLFHETLTGLRVYRFENEIQAIRAIPNRDIEPLTAIIKQTPEELNRIVMKCLAKDREARYQRVAEISADLLAFRKNMQTTYDADDLAAFMRERLTEGDDADCVV